MSKFRPNQETPSQPTILPPSQHTWQILLNEQASLRGKKLSEDDFKAWEKFLAPLPAMALQEAFDNWSRNGAYFPQPKNILDLVAAYKVERRIKFQPCGQDTCQDGWTRTFEGNTIGSSETPGTPVDPKLGAMKRCRCWHDWRNQSAA